MCGGGGGWIFSVLSLCSVHSNQFKFGVCTMLKHGVDERMHFHTESWIKWIMISNIPSTFA